ncbi:T9SS type A sorting domain-containing protein [Seonamhaeicola aphaedonensis]|uniref:Putative secreted protein (Por secretion system target) n=1 Tax=Seonamhaeicola aphaedonensis TaxID=1461338 RepID=A0A3D9HE72_9FLAO|nr:T9SS type A sorting domain-containing protein [Seonamhaeicola aphaedonensis]RED47787.1 putative secreted protein (Por secretion system target) [Seonamhaeicola aphaedonensis]
MKNFTFKFTVLILFAAVFQTQAQIQNGDYTIKNKETGKYLSTGGAELAALTGTQEGWRYETSSSLNGAKTTFNLTALDANGTFEVLGSRGLMKIFISGPNYGALGQTNGYSPAADRRAIFVNVSGNDYRFHLADIYVRENETNQTIDGDNVGTITAVPLDANDNRQIWTIEAAVLSNDDFNLSSVFISNPINDFIQIKGLSSNINKVEVFNLVGKSLIQKSTSGASSLSLDATALSSGVYVVKFIGTNTFATRKVVKR